MGFVPDLTWGIIAYRRPGSVLEEVDSGDKRRGGEAKVTVLTHSPEMLPIVAS